jgi:hypothetical protein
MPAWVTWLRSFLYPPELVTEQEAPVESPNPSNLYTDLLVRRMDHVFGQIDAIDAKASTASTTASGLLPVTLALLALAGDTEGNSTVGTVFATFCATAAYVGLAAYFYAGYGLRKWKNPPALEDWQEQFTHPERHSDEKIRSIMGGIFVKDIRTNESLLDRKVFYTKKMFLLLFIEAICLTAASVLPLLPLF